MYLHTFKAFFPQHIPALCRRDVQLSGIKHHFYPDGGWGWVIVLCSLLAQCLTTGLLLSGGTLLFELLKSPEFSTETLMNVSLVVVTAWAVTSACSPFIIILCNSHSPRLVAVAGGLIINLAFLFTSFSHQLHQVFVSYSILLPIGCSTVRDASSVMVGQYFKENRLLAERISLLSIGPAIVMFFCLYKKCIGYKYINNSLVNHFCL